MRTKLLLSSFSFLVASYAFAESPQVSFLLPVNNQSISSPIQAAVVPGNTDRLVRVDFYLDKGFYGTPTATSTHGPFRLTLDPKKLSVGYHSIGANGFDASGQSDFEYVSFYVARSSVVTSCADTVFAIFDATNDQIVGGIWGTAGDMGSGGWVGQPHALTNFYLPTIPKASGNYGVEAQVNDYVKGLTTTCNATIPNYNGCPKLGHGGVISVWETAGSSSTFHCQVMAD